MTEQTIHSGEQLGVNRDYQLYRQNLPKNQTPQTVGLAEHDYAQALGMTDSLVIDVVSNEGEEYKLPLLEPIQELYWYNSDYLGQVYGDIDRVKYTSPLPDPSGDAVQRLSDAIQSGNVCVIESQSKEDQVAQGLLEQVNAVSGSNNVILEPLGSGQERFLNQYVAVADYAGKEGFFAAKSLYDVYLESVESGETIRDSVNGATLEEVIDGDEAETLWGFYDEPFQELSEGHPIRAGFDHQSFLDMLKDPSVVKVLNRVDGQPTTLTTFVTDLDSCPWLNKDFYKEQYPEAFDTDNIFVFTGIVTDKKRRGESYSAKVIGLLVDTAVKRGSSTLITFECNEISAEVTPKIVKFGLEMGGKAQVSGLDEPVSQLRYLAMRRSDPAE